MNRRFVLQLGAATLALAMCTTAVFADSEAPGSTSSTSSESVTTVTTEGDAVVEVQQTSTQSATEGPLQPTESPAPPNAPESINSIVVENTISNNLAPLEAPATPEPFASTQHTTPSLAAERADALAAVKSAILVFNKSAAADTLALESSPSANGNMPTSPQEPLGLLDELSSLLNGMVMPILNLFGVFTEASIIPATLVVLLAAIIFAFSVPKVSYAALLRRSGFQGAPRSDVGATTSFCHSTLMGFIPVRSST